MEIMDNKQVYNILQNLTNLEISYMEYSKFPKDYVKYQTYLDYFNHHIIKSHNLSRFYFPPAICSEKYPKNVNELDEITERTNIFPGYDFSAAKQFNFPNALRHKCDYYTLIYLLSGQGSLGLDDRSFPLLPGDFYLIPPQVYYALESSLESICICFNLRQSFIAAEYKNIFQNDPLIINFITNSLATEDNMAYLALHTNNSENITNLVLSIFAEYVNQDKYSNNAMKNYLSLLFATILRDDTISIDSSLKVSRIDRQYEQILNYLKQNYQTASLSSLSEYMHFSKQYLCKIVRDKTGQTFNTLLMGIRLDMVVQFLSETSLSLENISYLCGFTAPSHLSKVFKIQYGISPSLYRKKKGII